MIASTRSAADSDLRAMRRRAFRPARLLFGLTVPLLLVLACAGALFAWRDYNDRRTSVLADTQLLARAAGADADRFLSDRLEALTLIANSPPVASGDVGAMRTYFRMLLDQPTYARLSWFDLSGTRRASNLDDPPTGPLMVSSREYFRTVVATGKPYVDAAVTSLQDGAAIITAAVPTFDAQGRLSGVLINPITLDTLEGVLATFQGRDVLVMVVDRANQLVTDADPKTGFQPVTNTGLLSRARAQGRGALSSVAGPLG